MAKNYLITGYWGEPHVTSENDRGIHAAIFGPDKYILQAGECFKAEYIGNNTIRMYDGKLMVNGAAAGIPAGEYIDFLIPNAGQGMSRFDLIVFQYSRDPSTLIERGEFVVIHGEETSGSPVLPTLIQNDLLSGNATFDQMALWRVTVSETNIEHLQNCYSTNEGSIIAPTMLNRAPSGYGLGDIATLAHNLNLHHSNGWFYFGPTASNKPEHIDYGCLLVVNRSGTEVECVQLAYDPISGIKAQRTYRNTATGWSEWEYENPPMAEGVEYRTTERWLGKPVYTKLVEYTATSNIGNSGSSYGFSVSFSTPNFKNLIRYCGTIEGTGRAIPCFYNPEEGGGYIGLNFMNTQGVAVEMNKVTLTAGTKLLIQVWYVKN